MNNYMCDLIRTEMLNLLGLNKNSSSDEIKSKWYEYKGKNNL